MIETGSQLSANCPDLFDENEYWRSPRPDRNHGPHKTNRYRDTTACFGLSTAFGLEAYLRTMVLVGVPVV